MKVLWISNIVFPVVENKLLNNNTGTNSGGWMVSLASEIRDKVQLTIAAPSGKVRNLERIELDGIEFFIFPLGNGNIRYNKDYEQIWREIHKRVLPDIVHLHGTEYSHGLAFINACGCEKVIVSMQGVMSEISEHYNDGLSDLTIFRHFTFRDIMRHTLFGEKREVQHRAHIEKQILEQVKYIIGRTEFDHAHVVSINPMVQYFHCDEVLRDEFYDGDWEFEKCKPYTILLSSAKYPLKGAHMVIAALPQVIKQFPEVQLRIAGKALPLDESWRRTLKFSGYQNIISRMIYSSHLQGHVTFLGSLSANEIKKELLNANIFVSPSSNENSSNSIAEAQILGVPCLASYVGGTPDMIPNTSCGELYNFFDIDVLAYKICKLFEESRSFDNTLMKQHALHRHCKESITRDLLSIYNKVALF